MISIRQAFRYAALAVLALGAASVSAEEPTRGGTLVWSIGSTPRHLNPAVQSGTATGQPGSQLFATPLRFDENWNPQPYLAREWDISEDGLTVTLKLVEGATFHDGHPITSSDVAFSIMTVKEHHPFKTMMAPVESVETPDDLTAIIKLSKPHPALLLAMSSQLLSIIPEHIYGDGQNPKTHPRNSEDVVGSGPFKFVEFKRRPAHHPRSQRELLHRGAAPTSTGSSCGSSRTRPRAPSRWRTASLMLTTFESTPREIARMKKVDHLVVTDQGYAAIGPIVWLAFNHQRAPTSDPRGAQGDRLRRRPGFHHQRPAPRCPHRGADRLPPREPVLTRRRSSPTTSTSTRPISSSTTRGTPAATTGMRFKLFVDFGWAAVRPHAEYLKPQLKKIGIDVTVRPSPDFPSWAKRVSNHEFRPHLGHGVQLGRPGDRGAPHVPEQQHQEGGHLVEHARVCQPEGRRDPGAWGKGARHREAQGVLLGTRRSCWRTSCRCTGCTRCPTTRCTTSASATRRRPSGARPRRSTRSTSGPSSRAVPSSSARRPARRADAGTVRRLRESAAR